MYGDRLGEIGGQLDVNFGISSNIGLRLNAMSEKLDNHRDHYDGNRTGFNPSLRIELSERFFGCRYEYVNNEIYRREFKLVQMADQ